MRGLSFATNTGRYRLNMATAPLRALTTSCCSDRPRIGMTVSSDCSSANNSACRRKNRSATSGPHSSAKASSKAHTRTRYSTSSTDTGGTSPPEPNAILNPTTQGSHPKAKVPAFATTFVRARQFHPAKPSPPSKQEAA